MLSELSQTQKEKKTASSHLHVEPKKSQTQKEMGWGGRGNKEPKKLNVQKAEQKMITRLW